MKTVTRSFDYQEYASPDEMDPRDRELVQAARDAQKTSYAPYSGFNVGAAVRLEDGTIVKGSNQENSAYPSGLCAERTAMFAASAAHPERPWSVWRSSAASRAKSTTNLVLPAAPADR